MRTKLQRILRTILPVGVLILAIAGFALVIDGRQSDGGWAIVVIATFGLVVLAFDGWMARRGYPLRRDENDRSR